MAAPLAAAPGHNRPWRTTAALPAHVSAFKGQGRRSERPARSASACRRDGPSSGGAREGAPARPQCCLALVCTAVMSCPDGTAHVPPVSPVLRWIACPCTRSQQELLAGTRLSAQGGPSKTADGRVATGSPVPLQARSRPAGGSCWQRPRCCWRQGRAPRPPTRPPARWRAMPTPWRASPRPGRPPASPPSPLRPRTPRRAPAEEPRPLHRSLPAAAAARAGAGPAALAPDDAPRRARPPPAAAPGAECVRRMGVLGAGANHVRLRLAACWAPARVAQDWDMLACVGGRLSAARARSATRGWRTGCWRTSFSTRSRCAGSRCRSSSRGGRSATRPPRR